MNVFSNKYSRFIIRGLLFFFVIFLFDQVAGRILRKFYFSSNSGENYQTIFSMDMVDSEVIILGSSRANHHYVPELIETKLGIDCYNAGRDGSFLLYNYSIFKELTKRYLPKIIILDINPEEMYYNKRYYEGLSTLLPFYKDRIDIRPIIETIGPYEKLKLISGIYPFNSTLFALLKGNLNTHNSEKENKDGYLPLYGNKIGKILKSGTNENINEPFDSNKIKYLKKLSEECKEKDIKLVVVASPRYKGKQFAIAKKEIKKIIESHYAIFLDYSNDSTFIKNSRLFKDQAHLNDNGARVFTKLLLNRLVRDSLIRINN